MTLEKWSHQNGMSLAGLSKGYMWIDVIYDELCNDSGYFVCVAEFSLIPQGNHCQKMTKSVVHWLFVYCLLYSYKVVRYRQWTIRNRSIDWWQNVVSCRLNWTRYMSHTILVHFTHCRRDERSVVTEWSRSQSIMEMLCFILFIETYCDTMNREFIIGIFLWISHILMDQLKNPVPKIVRLGHSHL